MSRWFPARGLSKSGTLCCHALSHGISNQLLNPYEGTLLRQSVLFAGIESADSWAI